MPVRSHVASLVFWRARGLAPEVVSIFLDCCKQNFRERAYKSPDAERRFGPAAHVLSSRACVDVPGGRTARVESARRVKL